MLPRLQAFDEKDLSDKPKWLRKQARKRLGKSLKQTIASERRRRLEQLISVDEAVAAIVAELEDEGILADTYIIFASVAAGCRDDGVPTTASDDGPREHHARALRHRRLLRRALRSLRQGK